MAAGQMTPPACCIRLCNTVRAAHARPVGQHRQPKQGADAPRASQTPPLSLAFPKSAAHHHRSAVQSNEVYQRPPASTRRASFGWAADKRFPFRPHKEPDAPFLAPGSKAKRPASPERLALNVQWPYTENSTQPEFVMDRRTSLLTTFALAVGAAGAPKTASAQSTSGMKVTVLYGHPKNAEDFEKYYFGTHMPLVTAAKGGNRSETSRCPPAADGSPAAFYRIFEIWFDSPAEMTAITTSQEWKKVRADVENFATGGVTRIVSKLD